MAEEGERVAFERGGVCVHTRVRRPWAPEAPLAGVLRLLERPGAVTLQWEPLERPQEPPGATEEAKAEDEEEEEEEDEEDEEEEEEEAAELFDPGYEPDWAVVSAPRAPPPPPHAPAGGPWGFRLGLAELRAVRRGRRGLGVPFLVLVTRDGTCPPALHFHRGGARALLRALARHRRLLPCPRDPRLLLVAAPGAEPQLDAAPGLVARLLQAPYAATLGGLSRVSRLLGAPRGPAPAEEEAEPPFEVIACVRLGPRPRPPRGPPVTEAEWGRSCDAEGRIRDPEGLRWRLFRGGLSPGARRQGWRCLLGLRPWGCGDAEEAARARQRRDDYARMKLQWRSLSPGQERRNRPLRRYRRRLERDLARGEAAATAAAGPARVLLRDVLMTYCMYNFDLGYVGGMSELLVPLLAVAPDEVEAFWGFCGLMELAGSAFSGSREQLVGPLGQLLRVLDPPLYDHLAPQGLWGLCRRLLQLRYRPPLDLEGLQRLWEVLWTGLPCPNFQLLVACGMLEAAGAELLQPGDGDGDGDKDGDTDEDTDKDEDEGPAARWPRLDADDVLSRAEGLYWQLAATAELPPAVQELLGLGGPLKRPPPDAWAPPDAGVPWEPLPPAPPQDAGAPSG